MTILKGKIAIVTGSGTGIGKAIAIDMARHGASVVTNNRMPRPSGGDAESTAQEIIENGGKAVPFFGDVADFETARKLIQTAIDQFGTVDILVNNAGAEDKRAMPWEMAADDWHSTIGIHLTGAFNCIRHASGVMKDQKWGRIINTTSRAWIAAAAAAPNYAAAMAGIVGLTGDVARNIGKYGVTCNAYSPAAKSKRTDVSKFQRALDAGLISKDKYEMMVNKPDPEDCAPLVTYLASDAAANINGQIFGISGIKVGETCVFCEICIFSQPVEHKVIRKEGGLWTQEELNEMVPKVLLEGYLNPAPRQQ